MMAFTPPLRMGAAVLALLLLHAVLATVGLRHVGPTNDETAHLTAGYTYWKFGDYRLQPENGNLPQRWGALPLLAMQPHLDPADQPQWWRETELWLISDFFLYSSDNDPDRLLTAARWAMVFWPLATGCLVFAWSRHLWGNRAGLFSLALYALSPTILAHGPLVTSDSTVVFWLLAAAGAFWQALEKGGAWIAGSAAATGVAFVAKFSCVLLVPTFLLLGLWHVLSRPRTGHDRGQRARRVVFLLLLNGFAAYLCIWLFFGFRFDANAPGMPPIDKFILAWEETLSIKGPVTDAIQLARQTQFLPEAYMEGFAHLRFQGSARAAFLAGEYGTTGWWWFFPAAFLWKSTPMEWGVVVALAGLIAFRLRKRPAATLARCRRLAPLLVFGAVFSFFTLTSPLNIGHRHILPLYPILFVFAGALMAALPAARQRWMLVPPALALVSALSVAPHYLTYFNLPSGGPQQGWHKLVDSSLDWGQGLPALATWVADHHDPAEPLYVSYFGSDSLRYRLPDAIPLAPIYDHYRPRPFVELQPGLYCIGATMLQDIFSPVAGPWNDEKEAAYRRGMAWARGRLEAGTLDNRIVDFGREDTEALWQVDRLRFARLMRYLRVRPADAIVANCVLVFRLNALELQAMIEGPPEVVDLMLQSAAAGQIPGRD